MYSSIAIRGLKMLQLDFREEGFVGSVRFDHHLIVLHEPRRVEVEISLVGTTVDHSAPSSFT